MANRPIRRSPGLEGYGPAGRSAWLDVDWDAHVRTLRIGGRSAVAVDMGPARRGEATPILFVHGLSGSWQNWLENLPHFAASRRVVAVDLPGFGRSEMPAERISIPGYARFLDELLTTLHIDRAIVVGHSLGGFVSAETAIRFPDRVERLVLVSAAGLSAQTPDTWRRIAALRRLERPLAAWGRWLALRSDVLARRRRSRRLVLALAVHRGDLLPALLLAEQLRASGTPGYLDAIHAVAVHPFRHRLQEISCPTLIVWGRQDRLVPVGDADGFQKLIPGSRKTILEHTGHMPMLERPAVFNALVQGFLEPVSATPAVEAMPGAELAISPKVSPRPA
jgi:pimeloyl-ACP methyl ester carboxylesterase